MFAGFGENRREIFLPRALGLFRGSNEVNHRTAEGSGAFRRDGFVDHEQAAVGAYADRGIGGHERIGRRRIRTDIDNRSIETRPRASGSIRDGDPDALMITVRPVEAFRGHDAIAQVAHVIETEFFSDAENRRIMRTGAVPKLLTAGRQNHIDVAIGPMRRIGDRVRDFRVRDPRVVTESGGPTRVKEMILTVVALHGRATPDTPIRIFENSSRGDGL